MNNVIFTPRALIDSLVAKLPVVSGSVYDSACGEGALLVSVIDEKVRRGAVRRQAVLECKGCEIDESLRATCIDNIVGDDHDLRRDVENNIVLGDGLKDHFGVKFDIIVANPPYTGVVGTQLTPWMMFTVHNFSLLRDHGVMINIVPVNVIHAHHVRMRDFVTHDIVHFGPNVNHHFPGVGANISAMIVVKRKAAHVHPMTSKFHPLSYDPLDVSIAAKLFDPTRRNQIARSCMFKHDKASVAKMSSIGFSVKYTRHRTLYSSVAAPDHDKRKIILALAGCWLLDDCEGKYFGTANNPHIITEHSDVFHKNNIRLLSGKINWWIRKKMSAINQLLMCTMKHLKLIESDVLVDPYVYYGFTDDEIAHIERQSNRGIDIILE